MSLEIILTDCQFLTARVCHWAEQDNGPWSTDCGKEFTTLDGYGPPSQNDMIYCCFCGLPIEEVRCQDSDNDLD